EFQDLKITTVAPYVDVAYMAYHGSGQGKLSNFPLTISYLGIQTTPNMANISVEANVNLKESKDEGFGGSTQITVLADRDGYNFKYKGVQVDKISISVEKPGAYTIKGSIMFVRGDSVYGNGFRGDLEAKFASIELGATALFGNVHGTRYFYVDAMFAMKPGIQAGPMTIFGFSGGLYYRMRQRNELSGKAYEFGTSKAGLVYTPDPEMAIGIMAGVKFGVGSETAVNAEVKFEINFLKSGGINYISFTGEAQCITPPIPIDPDIMASVNKAMSAAGKDELASKPLKGAIAARVFMYKDFKNNVFHADMQMKINVAGVLKGVGPGGIAGWAVIHIEPDEWYTHIGTPDNPCGISLLGLAEMTGYFMCGHGIPNTMPIPAKIVEILNIDEASIAGQRDDNVMATGKGIAMGMAFKISTGDINFMMFYGHFDMGMGFDVMLSDFGPNAYCEGSAPPLGINGWYAKGQAYAYVDGQIGIRAKLFRKEKKCDILTIAAAVYLRAELPNPAWMFGVVGGHYDVLGGMLKGECRFEMELGTQCKIKGPKSPLLDLQLISDITPANNSDKIDIF
ncbi:MAG: hypothetical protein MI922_28850, partial [Bacteroidales bacterium]|nr:hypothetical protein [Bacteroidales bacterium]